ncbi:putative cAMP-binding protein - catabolite gene activator and regulatory subunit of cAMP-dependent protein kinase [Photobacterium gaetbulicola Gung47]|uniref:Putative cAMP-binding protein-catabolite gene activator and regulatory subunit of cAMP-dependent protein kinase n=1 Tax=Photobacterium gaetbulicola Gung47 TaxID=658445 RepID=A0A0C5WBR1_9GAMM|nr:Crp/Fnr family transcriptional regulator [Photobacterium gaetbulicola]AJR09076.1 putative cAMP-binding protein - catabolite gene activator and regulatory subunit of cAMP-dependent protein kinase [Photobacterium gaetbulicola Gung47]
MDIRTQLTHQIELKSFAKKQVVYRSGVTAKGFYYVDEGLVGLYQVSETGKESLLRIYGPGSFFGYRSLFTNQHYPSTARAMLDSKIVHVDVNDFKSLDLAAPCLADFLMKEVCAELGEAEKRLMQFNAFSAKKRILDTIYYVFHTYPEYPWTYREIGEYSGTDTTTVIRYCKTLKESGILESNSRKPLPVSLHQLADYRKSLLVN